MKTLRALAVILVTLPASAAALRADDAPSPEETRRALKKAATFFHDHAAAHGGYVWKYSGDLAMREAEGPADESVIWVQPPGTPAVGEAFLDAHETTRDRFYLEAARDAATALVLGQLHSGGWHYRIELDPEKRRRFDYRLDLGGRARPDPTTPAARRDNGWSVWRKRRYKGNQTILDDDTTQAALRFLMRTDAALRFQEKRIHEAVERGLESLLNAQYPIGAWSANWDRFPESAPDPTRYPVRKASYPESWSRIWTKAFNGCYVTNDDLTANAIRTLLRAWEVYRDARYLQAAEKAGRFLIAAQMPDPQPAWAQQYDRDVHPVWDRAFEPPAISGRESQTILEALVLLYRKTAKREFLEPIPRALAYLRESRLADGKLARFYELETNRPIYFTRRRGGGHELTHKRERLADNYAFVVDSRLETIEAEYERVRGEKDRSKLDRVESEPVASNVVRQVIDSLDSRGAWIEDGTIRNSAGRKTRPESGIIYSRTFIDNVRVLCRYLEESTER